MEDPEHPENGAELARRSAVGKFRCWSKAVRRCSRQPRLSSISKRSIPGGVRLLPANPEVAFTVRMMDRVFDNYVMNAMTMIVGNALRPEEHRDHYGVERAHATLDRIYAWLDGELGGRA